MRSWLRFQPYWQQIQCLIQIICASSTLNLHHENFRTHITALCNLNDYWVGMRQTFSECCVICERLPFFVMRFLYVNYSHHSKCILQAVRRGRWWVLKQQNPSNGSMWNLTWKIVEYAFNYSTGFPQITLHLCVNSLLAFQHLPSDTYRFPVDLGVVQIADSMAKDKKSQDQILGVHQPACLLSLSVCASNHLSFPDKGFGLKHWLAVLSAWYLVHHAELTSPPHPVQHHGWV